MRFKIEQVAVLINSSTQTIDNWYRFKRENPNHELSKLLPDYEQEGERQTRYWSPNDVAKLVEFKNNLPKGRNGVMGSVTQKYYRKKEQEVAYGKKKTNKKRTGKSR